MGEPTQSLGCISGTANLTVVGPLPGTKTHFVMESGFHIWFTNSWVRSVIFLIFVRFILFLFQVSPGAETQHRAVSPYFLNLHLGSGELETGGLWVLGSPLLIYAWSSSWFTAPPVGLLLTGPRHDGPFSWTSAALGHRKRVALFLATSSFPGCSQGLQDLSTLPL